MPRTPQDITDAELNVMEVLWNRKGRPITIRHLTAALYPNTGSTYYATVQKLLERLEEKECVVRDRSQSPHTFTAIADRSELIGRRLQKVAEQMCGGSLTPLLTHLVQGRWLSKKELQNLRDLIDELAEDNEKRGKG